jgi:hypothetical protein
MAAGLSRTVWRFLALCSSAAPGVRTSPAARGALTAAQGVHGADPDLPPRFADPQALAGAAARQGGTIGGFPYLMLIGTSKGGSTFLFECMEHAFHPRVVCGDDEAASWTLERCGARRFALPAIRMWRNKPRAMRGRNMALNDTFSVGVNSIKENYVFTRSIYRGPASQPESVRFIRGPALPLELWEDRRQRTRLPTETATRWLREAMRACARMDPSKGSCPLRDYRATGLPHTFRGMAGARAGEACGFTLADAAAAAAADVEVSVSTRALCAARGPGYPLRIFKDLRAFPPFPADAPPTRPWEARLVGLDGCPYNLGHTHAPALLRAMHASAESARAMRFIVLVRDPVDRAYSEWAMTKRWKGAMHRGGEFSAHAHEQVASIRACVGDARMGALIGHELPDSAFEELYTTCLRGSSFYSYVGNSLYGLHLRNWLRAGFAPASFLLLETEAMARTPAEALLGQLRDFTGLHFELAALASGAHAASTRAACSPKPQSARSPNLSGNGSLRTPVDAATRDALERFFFQGRAPWMHMIPPPQLRRSRSQL